MAARLPPPAPPSPAPRALTAVAACGLTDPGRERAENEDAWGAFTDERLFVVADGMGGRAAGDVASRLAVEELERFFRSFHANPRQPWPFPVDRSLPLGANLLNAGVKLANRRIHEMASSDHTRARMGATLVALAVGDERLSIAHVGDARAYRLRQGGLKRLTRDHSIVEEMKAARPEMSADELAAFAHKNVVTKALGRKADVDPTLFLNTFERGDVYLLCSDGLPCGLPDESIGAILTANDENLPAAARALVDAANDAGGADNVTVVLVRT